MLQRWVASIFTTYLGKYIKDLDKDDLQVSMWNGEVVLMGIELVPEALDEFDLPIIIDRGFIGKLRIEIPWKEFYSKTCKVHVEGVEIVAQPLKATPWNKEYEARKRRVRKQNRLHLFESTRAQAPAAKQEEEVPEGSEGFSARLGRQIIANLQVSLRDVILRYEDASTDPRRPVVMTLKLDEVAAVPCDSQWHNVEDTPGRGQARATARQFRLCSMRGLNISIDRLPVAPRLTGPSKITTLKKWKEIIRACGRVRSQAVTHTPVEVQLKITTQPASILDLSQPRNTVDASISSVNISLKRWQYDAINRTVRYVADFATLDKFRQFKPTTGLREDPRAWWQYAFDCVRFVNAERRQRTQLNWEYLRTRNAYKQQYIQLYKRSQQVAGMRQEPLSAAETNDLAGLEEKLDVEDIIYFRRLAYFQLRVKQQERGGDDAAAAAAAAPAQDAAQAQSGGWLWGLLGYGAAAANDSASHTDPHADPQDDELQNALRTGSLTAAQREILYQELGIEDDETEAGAGASPEASPAKGGGGGGGGGGPHDTDGYVQTLIQLSVANCIVAMCDNAAPPDTAVEALQLMGCELDARTRKNFAKVTASGLLSLSASQVLDHGIDPGEIAHYKAVFGADVLKAIAPTRTFASVQLTGLTGRYSDMPGSWQMTLGLKDVELSSTSSVTGSHFPSVLRKCSDAAHLVLATIAQESDEEGGRKYLIDVHLHPVDLVLDVTWLQTVCAFWGVGVYGSVTDLESSKAGGGTASGSGAAATPKSTSAPSPAAKDRRARQRQRQDCDMDLTAALRMALERETKVEVSVVLEHPCLIMPNDCTELDSVALVVNADVVTITSNHSATAGRRARLETRTNQPRDYYNHYKIKSDYGRILTTTVRQWTEMAYRDYEMYTRPILMDTMLDFDVLVSLVPRNHHISRVWVLGQLRNLVVRLSRRGIYTLERALTNIIDFASNQTGKGSTKVRRAESEDEDAGTSTFAAIRGPMAPDEIVQNMGSDPVRHYAEVDMVKGHLRFYDQQQSSKVAIVVDLSSGGFELNDGGLALVVHINQEESLWVQLPTQAMHARWLRALTQINQGRLLPPNPSPLEDPDVSPAANVEYLRMPVVMGDLRLVLEDDNGTAHSELSFSGCHILLNIRRYDTRFEINSSSLAVTAGAPGARQPILWTVNSTPARAPPSPTTDGHPSSPEGSDTDVAGDNGDAIPDPAFSLYFVSFGDGSRYDTRDPNESKNQLGVATKSLGCELNEALCEVTEIIWDFVNILMQLAYAPKMYVARDAEAARPYTPPEVPKAFEQPQNFRFLLEVDGDVEVGGRNEHNDNMLRIAGEDLFLIFHDTPYGINVEGSLRRPLVEDTTRPSSLRWLKFVRGADDASRVDFTYTNLQNRGALKTEVTPHRPSEFHGYAFTHRLNLHLVRSEVAYLQTFLWELLEYFMTGVLTRFAFLGWRGVYNGKEVDVPYDRYVREAVPEAPYYDMLQFAIDCSDCSIVLPPDRDAELGVLRGAAEDVGVANFLRRTKEGDVYVETVVAIHEFVVDVPEEMSDEVPQGKMFRDPLTLTLSTKKALVNPHQRLVDTVLALNIPGPTMMFFSESVYCAFLRFLTENLMEPWTARYPPIPPAPLAYDVMVDAVRYNHFTWQFRVPDASVVWLGRGVPLYTCSTGLHMDIRWYKNDDFEEDILLSKLGVCAGVDQGDRVLRFDDPISEVDMRCLGIYIKWTTPEEAGARRVQHLHYDVPLALDLLVDVDVLTGLVDSLLGAKAARSGGYKLMGWVEPSSGWPAPGEAWPPAPPPQQIIQHTLSCPSGVTIVIPSIATASFSGELQYTWHPGGRTIVCATMPSVHMTDFLRRKIVTTDGGDALTCRLERAGGCDAWSSVAAVLGEVRVVAAVDSLSAIYRWGGSHGYRSLVNIWAPTPQLREVAIQQQIEAKRARDAGEVEDVAPTPPLQRSPVAAAAARRASMQRTVSTISDGDLVEAAAAADAPPRERQESAGPTPANDTRVIPEVDIKWSRPKLEILCSKRIHRGFQIDFGVLQVRSSSRTSSSEDGTSKASADDAGDEGVEVHLDHLSVRNIHAGSYILQPAHGKTNIALLRHDDGSVRYNVHVRCDKVESKLEFTDVRTLAAVAHDYAEAIKAAQRKPAKKAKAKDVPASSPRATVLVQSPRARARSEMPAQTQTRTPVLTPAGTPDDDLLEAVGAGYGGKRPRMANSSAASSVAEALVAQESMPGSTGAEDYAEVQFAFDFPSVALTFRSGACTPDDLPLPPLHEPKVDSTISFETMTGVCVVWHSGITDIAVKLDRFAVSSPLGDLIDVQDARFDYKTGQVPHSIAFCDGSFDDANASRAFMPGVSFALGSGGLAGTALGNPGLSFAGVPNAGPSFMSMAQAQAMDAIPTPRGGASHHGSVACQTIDLQISTVRLTILPQVAFAMMNFVYLPYAAAIMPDTFASSDVIEVDDDLDLTADLILHRDRKLHISGRYQNLIRINGNLHELHFVGDKPLIRIDAGVTLHIVNTKIYLYGREFSDCILADDGAYVHADPHATRIDKGFPPLPTARHTREKSEHDSSRMRVGARFALSIVLPDSQEQPKVGLELSCEADGESDTATREGTKTTTSQSSACFNLCNMAFLGGTRLQGAETTGDEPTEILQPVERVTLQQKGGGGEYDVSSTAVHMRLGSADAALILAATSSLQGTLDSIAKQAQFKIARDDELIIRDAVAQGQRQMLKAEAPSVTAGLNLSTIDVLIVEDSQGFDLPLFFTQINEVGLSVGSEAGMAAGERKMSCKLRSLEMNLDFYNLEVCEWQSMLSRSVKILPPSRYVSSVRGNQTLVEVHVALSPISLIITPQFLKTLHDANKFAASLTTSSSAESQAKAATRQAPLEFRQYELLNQTGFPLDVTLADLTTLGTTLQNMNSWHFNFGKKYGKDVTHAVVVNVQGQPEKELIVIGRVGTSEFKLKKDDQRVRLFCCVKLTETGRKKVYLRSRVTLVNELPITLEVTAGEQLLTAPAGESVSIPHHALNVSNLKLVPNFGHGCAFRPSQIGIAYGLFHKLHRGVFTVMSTAVSEESYANASMSGGYETPRRAPGAPGPQIFTCVADVNSQTGAAGDTNITFLPVFSMENLTGLTLTYRLYTWDGREERRSGFGKIFSRSRQGPQYDLVAQGRLGTDETVDFTQADPYHFMYLDLTVVQPTGRELKRADKHAAPFLVRGQTKNHQGRCSYVTLTDEKGRLCHLDLEYTSRKVTVSCPLWIINQTTFFVELAVHNPMKLGQTQSETSQSALTAGQTLGEGIKPGARPFLMAPDPPDKDHQLGHLYCRIMMDTGYPPQWKEGWSSKIDVSEVGIMGTFECPPTAEGELPKTMAYTVEFPWGKVATRTRVIRITPRWIILNRTPKPIYVRHEVKGAKGLPGGQLPRSTFDVPPLAMHQEYHGGDSGNLIAVKNHLPSEAAAGGAIGEESPGRSQLVDPADIERLAKESKRLAFLRKASIRPLPDKEPATQRAKPTKTSLYCKPFGIDKTGDIDLTLKYIAPLSTQSPSAARKRRAESIFADVSRAHEDSEEFDVVRASVFRRGCITYVTVDPLTKPPYLLENRTQFRVYAKQRVPEDKRPSTTILRFPPRTTKAFTWDYQQGTKKLLIAEDKAVLERIKGTADTYPKSGVLEVDLDIASTSTKTFEDTKQRMIITCADGEHKSVYLRLRHQNGTTRISLTTDQEIDSTFSAPHVQLTAKFAVQEVGALLCTTALHEVAHLCIRDVAFRMTRRRHADSDVVVMCNYLLHVNRFQLDDQRDTPEHPVVIVNKIPQDQKPFLLVKCEQKIASYSAAIHIKDCAVVLQPLVVKIHDKFLFQLLEFYNATYEKIVLSGRAVGRKYYTTPDTFVGAPAMQEGIAQRTLYLERFRIDAIELTAWLVRSSQDSDKDFFKKILGSYALFVRGFEDLSLIWPKVAVEGQCNKGWVMSTILRDRYASVSRRHLYRVAPGVASVHTFVTDLLATLPTKNSEPMVKYQTPKERIKKPSSRAALWLPAGSADTSAAMGSATSAVREGASGIPHLVGSEPDALNTTRGLAVSESGASLYGDTAAELTDSLALDEFVDVSSNAVLKSVGYYGELTSGEQDSFYETSSPMIGKTRAEVVKMLKKKSWERSHPSYGKTSWVEYAQVLTWDEFKTHTTDAEFRAYAHLALDAYIRSNIADPHWAMEPRHCRCDQVSALAEHLPYGLEPPSAPSSQGIKLTWWEFAHHTSWDDFKRRTTEKEFKTYAHMARDVCMGRTEGFRKIGKKEYVPMFTM